MRNPIRTDEQRDLVSRLARKVRLIKEERGIPYSEVASECLISLGRINGLVNGHVLVSEEVGKVQNWVKEWERRLHD